MSSEPAAFKETFFNHETVQAFSGRINGVYPDFEPEIFIRKVFDDSWDERSLMERIRHLTRVLHGTLPREYRLALDILLRAQGSLDKSPNTPADENSDDSGTDVSGFIDMVPSDYAAVYGLDDPDASIPALEAFTQVMSAEFAVRPFIKKYPQRMMAQMLHWADHPNFEVRRLSSEGCRPRLPWGIRLYDLVNDPGPIIPILEALKMDESVSVRRSVANNLNDISKDNPAVTLAVLQRWNNANGSREEIAWITNHALRTLLKRGNKEALELLGYSTLPRIKVEKVCVDPPTIAFGESINITFEIQSTGKTKQKLMIDYVVYHMRSSGGLTAKVFKLKKTAIQPGEVIKIRRIHSFRPVTIRRYYPGEYGIQPQINGRLYERVNFELNR